MTAGETRLYLATWGRVRKILRRQGVAPKDADARRHAIHVEALGAAKSSKHFNSQDLDEVLKRFGQFVAACETDADRAIREERRPADSARARKLWVLDDLLRQLGKPRAYAAAVARNQGAETVDFDRMEDADFRRILAALNGQVRRGQGKSWPRKAKPVAAAAPDDNEPF